MFLKVIYRDGTAGVVKASTIDELMETGKIFAYHCSEGWVEVRRKQSNPNYQGPERRKYKLPQATPL